MSVIETALLMDRLSLVLFQLLVFFVELERGMVMGFKVVASLIIL